MNVRANDPTSAAVTQSGVGANRPPKKAPPSAPKVEHRYALGLSRGGLATHEEELGPDQADSLCPGLQRPRCVIGRSDVGYQPDPFAVCGGGRAIP